MTRTPWIALGVVALVSVAAGWWWHTQNEPSTATPIAETGPVAQVKVVPLRRNRIERTLTAYGTVVAAPGEARTVSAPFESRVRTVFTTAGEVLQPGAPLLDIEPSPGARLQFEKAQIERSSALEQLTLIRQRLDLKLATRQDLLPAEQRLRDAELQLESMRQQGVDRPRLLRAGTPGLVSRIAVQVGQIVPPGGVLLETIGRDQITIRLGVESEDVARLQAGQAVRLFPVNTPARRALDGRIGLITEAVNPQTRLVDLFVAPPPGSHLLLNQYMEGRIILAARDALAAPRAAVLPEGDHFVIYTFENGRAVKHVVRIGLENADEVEVIGEGLQEGQLAVVVGNSELKDAMTVQVEPSE